ncbi:helix-turn-helix domain-containing protein [Oleidesulfovibrio sp.]|uniref:helix-turn-helix domain-containing protein n=1 Tax=Oleidesulfovibrio sp. TaxID=2909707 RepID=UPI003A838611
MNLNNVLTIESWIVDMTQVTFTARAVYSQLVGLAKKQGFAWPSQQFLANRLGVSLRTVSSCIGELVKAGLLDVAKPVFLPDEKGKPGTPRTAVTDSCPDCGKTMRRLESKKKKGALFWACESGQCPL